LKRQSNSGEIAQHAGCLSPPRSWLKSVDRLPRRLCFIRHPLVVSHLMEKWRALWSWTPDYLRLLAGSQRIPVWVANDAGEWSGKMVMSLNAYFDWIFESPRSEICDPEYGRRCLYAARLSLDNLNHRLFSDIEVPVGFTRNNMGLWIGKAGTSSGLHWDDEVNAVAQVRGSKDVAIFPPHYWRRFECYPTRRGPRARTPQARRRPAGGQECEPMRARLSPSQMLLIPPGWWHDITSVDELTISISFWLPVRR
jgi:lysine-specific demethylase 8